MWATFSMDDAQKQLGSAIESRLLRRSGWLGSRTRPTSCREFGYWNDDSSKYFDVVFPGWGKDGEAIVFERDAFLHCRAQVEAMSKWQYSGNRSLNRPI